MRTLRMAETPVVRVVVHVLFALSLAALLTVGLAGGGTALTRSAPGVALASSSSPFAAPPSPATTLAPSGPTTTVTPTTVATGVRTGEPWASRWFMWLLGLAILLGTLALWPTVARRPGRVALPER